MNPGGTLGNLIEKHVGNPLAHLYVGGFIHKHATVQERKPGRPRGKYHCGRCKRDQRGYGKCQNCGGATRRVE